MLTLRIDPAAARGRCAVLTTVLLLCLLLSAEATAQVGDVSDVNHPGWERLDLVEPTIVPSVTFDTVQTEWRYGYTVHNGTGAQQAIEDFMLRYNTPRAGEDFSLPSGWFKIRVAVPAAIPGGSFVAKVSGLATTTRQPAPDQIPPGDSLTGFGIDSPYPPGYARTFVKGYAPTQYHTESDIVTPMVVPHDTTNSQRGWTVAPTLYGQVLTTGDGTEPTDGFLGFMSLRTAGSVLLDPAPIALELSVNEETVFPETLVVTLNGVNVTARFHPGPEEGADLVGLFHLETSSLKEGMNVLVTNIQGQVPGTQQTGTDTDLIEFSVNPAADRPSELPF